MEIARQLLLVGLMVLFEPGKVVQLVVALVIALVTTILQVQAQPYRSLSDNFFALSANVAVVVMLLGCIVLKQGVPLELPDVQARLSPSLRARFQMPVSNLLLILQGGFAIAFVTASVVLLGEMWAEYQRLLKARSLCLLDENGKVVHAPELDGKKCHVVLSASQVGLDAMREVKKHLEKAVNGLKIAEVSQGVCSFGYREMLRLIFSSGH